jgi:hypothetical protein
MSHWVWRLTTNESETANRSSLRSQTAIRDEWLSDNAARNLPISTTTGLVGEEASNSHSVNIHGELCGTAQPSARRREIYRRLLCNGVGFDHFSMPKDPNSDQPSRKASASNGGIQGKVSLDVKKSAFASRQRSTERHCSVEMSSGHHLGEPQSDSSW